MTAPLTSVLPAAGRPIQQQAHFSPDNPLFLSRSKEPEEFACVCSCQARQRHGLLQEKQRKEACVFFPFISFIPGIFTQSTSKKASAAGCAHRPGHQIQGTSNYTCDDISVKLKYSKLFVMSNKNMEYIFAHGCVSHSAINFYPCLSC